MFSALLLAQDENGERLTDDEVRDELMTLLLAGHETTATGLAWTFDLLLHNAAVLAARAPTATSAYLDAVVKEALRLRPVIPGVGRVVARAEPFELGGYVVPAGHRDQPLDPDHPPPRRPLPRPGRFRPERFLGPGGAAGHLHVGPVRRRHPPLPRRQLRADGDADRARRVLERATLAAVNAELDRGQFRGITLAPKEGVQVFFFFFIKKKKKKKKRVSSRAMLLYDSAVSGNCYKVRLLFAQLGIAYERRELDVIDRTDRPKVLGALNPGLRVPTLVFDDGRALGESDAILFRLAEGTPSCRTDPFERAQVLQWMFFEQYSHEPNIAVLRFWAPIAGTEPPRRRELRPSESGGHARAGRAGAPPARAVSGLSATRYSIADIALYAYTHVAPEGGFDLAALPGGPARGWLGWPTSPATCPIDD